MSDLIDRQAVIEKMRNRKKLFCKNTIEYSVLSKDEKARVDEIDNCISDLLNAPDAEPEREKGCWIVKEEDWRKQLEWDECSECGFATTKRYNFCPNCGADMW